MFVFLRFVNFCAFVFSWHFLIFYFSEQTQSLMFNVGHIIVIECWKFNVQSSKFNVGHLIVIECFMFVIEYYFRPIFFYNHTINYYILQILITYYLILTIKYNYSLLKTISIRNFHKCKHRAFNHIFDCPVWLNPHIKKASVGCLNFRIKRNKCV